jgi:hypothetical protein
MNEFHLLAGRTVRYTAYMVAVFAILWVALPDYKSLFAGLTIGTAVSVYFAISVAKQVEMSGDVAERKQKKKPSVMMAYRMVMIMGAVLIVRALEPKIGYVSIPGLVIGFFVYQVIILGDFLYNKTKTS